jgi:uncharacterized membrane protein (UPF0127 family)
MGLKLVRKADQALILNDGVVAIRYFTRMRGLIGKKALNSGEGMLFPKCNSITMWMMSIPLDVVFLETVVPSKEWKVIELRSNLKPWKLIPATCLKADDTLELPVGTIERLGLKPGEVLCSAS